jgi:hypothetical protein
MNIVALSGTIGNAGPHISYTKNGKPQTTFELIVPNDDSPGFYTKESVLVVGMHAEVMCEQLEAGDEVELSGKLQRGQVVCFKVHVKQPALATAGDTETSASGEYDSGPDPGALLSEEPRAPESQKARKPRYPRALQEPWTRGSHN